MKVEFFQGSEKPSNLPLGKNRLWQMPLKGEFPKA